MKNFILATVTLTTGLLVSAPSHAATVLLFQDTFDRPAANTISASKVGQSGTIGTQEWIENNNNGETIVDSSGRLRMERTGDTSGGNGGLAFLDYNFDNLSSFEVRLDIRSFTDSGGDGRYLGFSVGESKAELLARSTVSPTNNSADVFVGYDVIGGTTGIQVYHNSVAQGYLGSPTLSLPDTLSAKFTFADMDTGTALNYEVFLNDVSVGTGSTTWSGTDENYIALQSNYSDFTYLDNFTVNGEVIPEPSSLILICLGGVGILLRRRK